MITVVMGFILNSSGEVLIAKRNLEKNFGGLWEFPGGKVEIGETYSEALEREMEEELSITVKTLREYDKYSFSNESIDIEFCPIHCVVVSGEIFNHEHEEILFVDIQELDFYDFAPPDYKAVSLLKQKQKEMLNMQCC